MFKNSVQIAGIIDFAEAEMLMRLGVNFLGFPLRLPVNKEDLSEPEAARIISKITPPHISVLITYLNQADEIIKFCSELNVSTIQLHGDISVKELFKLKRENPSLKIIKSLVIGEIGLEKLLNKMNELMPFVDAFITDTFNPATGASGATGLTHDWNISREICELCKKPVILAGGLTPANVYNAVKFVQPAGVDSHTGVEDSRGRKDPQMVAEFIALAKKAFAELNHK